MPSQCVCRSVCSFMRNMWCVRRLLEFMLLLLGKCVTTFYVDVFGLRRRNAHKRLYFVHAGLRFNENLRSEFCRRFLQRNARLRSHLLFREFCRNFLLSFLCRCGGQRMLCLLDVLLYCLCRIAFRGCFARLLDVLVAFTNTHPFLVAAKTECIRSHGVSRIIEWAAFFRAFTI